MQTALTAILVFGVIIFVHELGHFTVAKLTGVTVFEFSIGMGPALFSTEKNGTKYAVRILPIGGYVMLEGEDEAVDTPHSFSNQPVLHRIAILLAGSVNNILLGYFLLMLLTFLSGYVGTTRVVQFSETAVSSHYLELGDEITHINGHRVRTSNDITYEFLRDVDGKIAMTLLRKGEKQTLTVPFRLETLEEGIQAIDIDFKVAAIPATPLQYITYPLNWGLSIIKQVWGSFLDLLTGRYAVNQLSGPVGIVNAIGQASALGLKSILLIAAFIAINVGVFNLIPFPLLDGGKVLIALLEAIFHRKLSQKFLNGLMSASIALMAGLMLYVTWNDIFRLFGK